MHNRCVARTFPPIFMSYRRGDAGGRPARLHADLTHKLGKRSVFFDKAHMPAGEPFPEYLRRSVEAATVVLVVIGPLWQQRLDERREADDYVRTELQIALSDPAKRVIPVLIDQARLPVARELPDDLKAIVQRSGVEITDQCAPTRCIRSYLVSIER